ncbi:MAG: restriction endonuclease subunit S [Culicoidibacterales bacterium]
MENLNDKKWDEFTLESLFTIESGTRLTNANKIEGRIPFIGAVDNSNGTTGFVGNKNSSLDKNVLGVNYNGAPCIAFYHPYECVFTDDVKRLHLKDIEDDANTLLFFKTIVMQQRSKYSYGYKFKEKRMLRQKIVVPVTDTGEADYDYMSSYVEQKREEKLSKYKAYVQAKIDELDYKDTPELNDKEWKEYNISDLFGSVQRGKRLKKADHVEGDIAYISSTSMQNGVDSFIGNVINVRIFDNCLTIANSGSVGSTFYQPYKFIASDHVTSLKNEQMNKYIYLFLSVILERCKEKYNFNREINDHRISREKILLPIDEFEEPDYVYMEQYAKNIMYKKYKQYLSYINK